METNYKIIGGDGREYGPVPLDELKAWIRDGRVGRQTQIWRNDLNTWLPATQYQELQEEVGQLKQTSATTEFEPAGFWPRVGAYALDNFIILPILSFLILGKPAYDFSGGFDMAQLFGPRYLYDLALSFIYYVALNGQFGATLGKMVIGAKIVNLDGSKIGFGKAFLRMLAMMVSSLTLGIGYLMVAFREDKRALHDLIVGTKVIYKR